MHPAAVAFDMDGLLLDTERLALEAFQEACESLDLNVDERIYFRCIGTTAAQTRKLLEDALGLAFPYEVLEQAWSSRYATKALAGPVPLKEGARSLLRWVRQNGLPMALATSTAHHTAVLKLRNAGLLDFFEMIIGGDQVSRGKPHPETYLRVAAGLGVRSSSCLAIEDSNNGVRAAHAAGMAVIQVPDLVLPTDDVRSLGHPIFQSLRDVERHLKGR